MSEIPSPAWIVVGFLVGIVSLFLGFISPVTNSAFFKLMLFIGIGMMVYGFLKMKFSQKTKEDVIDEARRRSQARGQSEYDIDIDDYRNNPQMRQQAMQQGQPTGYQRTPQQPGQSAQSTGGNSGNAPQRYANVAPQHQKHPYVVQQQRANNTHHPMHPSQQNSTVHVLRQAHSHHPQQAGFCGQCGTPLLKHHKYCPMCGARV